MPCRLGRPLSVKAASTKPPAARGPNRLPPVQSVVVVSQALADDGMPDLRCAYAQLTACVARQWPAQHRDHLPAALNSYAASRKADMV